MRPALTATFTFSSTPDADHANCGGGVCASSTGVWELRAAAQEASAFAGTGTIITPLFDALVVLAEAQKVSFHTPRRQSGKGISTRFGKFVGSTICTIGRTTLDEVDCLQKPVGVIREAQALAAEAHGADRSFFLVNGLLSPDVCKRSTSFGKLRAAPRGPHAPTRDDRGDHRARDKTRGKPTSAGTLPAAE